MAASISAIQKVEHAWKFLYQVSNFYKQLRLQSAEWHGSGFLPPPGCDRLFIVCLKVFPSSSSSSTEYFRITLVSCRETLLRPWLHVDFPSFSTKGHTGGVCILYSLYRFDLSDPLVYLIFLPDKRLTWRIPVLSPFLIVIPPLQKQGPSWYHFSLRYVTG